MRKLILVVAALLAATTTVAAQQTPAQYCQSLAASSCEVLNLEHSASTSGSSAEIRYIVKICLNRKFISRLYLIDVNGTVRAYGLYANPSGYYQQRLNQVSTTGSSPLGNGTEALDFTRYCEAPW